MRLICPGCGAQYEVDDGVIPDAGRDVQCSACGHVWFQKSSPILLSGDEAVALPEDDWEPDGTPEMQVLPAFGAAALRDRLTEEDPEDSEEIRPAPAAGAVPRRPLDESLLSILREEAEREAQARRAESGLPETQEEMVLEPARPEKSEPKPEPKGRGASVALSLPKVFSVQDPLLVATKRASVASPPAPPAPAAVPDPVPAEPTWFKIVEPEAEPEVVSLPDVEEINSSLRASADRIGEAAALDAPQVLGQRRAGFRLGFGSVMLIAAAAIAAYGFAPQIGQAVPALGPVLDGYVAQVNTGRIWLDENLRAAIAEVQGVLRG